MELRIPIIAGAASTVIFALSTLPMLYKAGKSKDLGSYSLKNILLSNIGNLIHSIYVFSLPMGPIWLLHSFYLVSTALMLIWYLRYERGHARRRDGSRTNERRESDRSGAGIRFRFVGPEFCSERASNSTLQQTLAPIANASDHFGP